MNPVLPREKKDLFRKILRNTHPVESNTDGTDGTDGTDEDVLETLFQFKLPTQDFLNTPEPIRYDSMIAHIVLYSVFELNDKKYKLFLMYKSEDEILFPYVEVHPSDMIKTICNDYVKDSIGKELDYQEIKEHNDALYVFYDVSDYMNGPFFDEKETLWYWVSPYELMNYRNVSMIQINVDNIDFFMQHVPDLYVDKERLPMLLYHDTTTKQYYTVEHLEGNDVEADNFSRNLYFYDKICIGDNDNDNDNDKDCIIFENEEVKNIEPFNILPL